MNSGERRSECRQAPTDAKADKQRLLCAIGELRDAIILALGGSNLHCKPEKVEEYFWEVLEHVDNELLSLQEIQTAERLASLSIASS